MLLIVGILCSTVLAGFGEQEGARLPLVDAAKQASVGCTAHGDCGDTSFCASAARGARQCAPCSTCLSAQLSTGAETSCTPKGRCARVVCRKLYVDNPTMQQGKTWGRLPAAEQQLWQQHDCNRFARDLHLDRCMVAAGGGACFTGTGCAGRPTKKRLFSPPSAAELRVPRAVREYYDGYVREKLAPFARRVAALRNQAATPAALALRQAACEHHCSPSNVLRGAAQVDLVLAPNGTATGGVEVRAQHRTCTSEQRGYGFTPGKLAGTKRMLEHVAQSFGPELRRALDGQPLHMYFR
jgi:hypothetical protein